MILYFTGTGNSRFAADALADMLGDETVSINDIIKYDWDRRFHSEKPFIIVSPIYAWRLPGIIEKFITEAGFTGNEQIYIVATMGGLSGRTDSYCGKILSRGNMRYMGFRGIVMPKNYIAAYEAPDAETKDRILENAFAELKETADIIRRGEKLVKTDRTPAAALLSGPINRGFNKFGKTDRDYTVSDACIGCGLCEKICPVNNIEMKDGRPVFKGGCAACFACIHRCPERTINIKGKTERRGRYICPDYREWRAGGER